MVRDQLIRQEMERVCDWLTSHLNGEEQMVAAVMFKRRFDKAYEIILRSAPLEIQEQIEKYVAEPFHE